MITLPPYHYDARLVRKSIPLVPNHAMAAHLDMGDPLDSAGMVISTPATRVAAMPAMTTLPEPKLDRQALFQAKDDKTNKIKYAVIGAVAVIVIFVMYRMFKKK